MRASRGLAKGHDHRTQQPRDAGPQSMMHTTSGQYAYQTDRHMYARPLAERWAEDRQRALGASDCAALAGRGRSLTQQTTDTILTMTDMRLYRCEVRNAKSTRWL